MGRMLLTSTPRIYAPLRQCTTLPRLQSPPVSPLFLPSSPHNALASRASLLLPEVKWPLVPPSVIQGSNTDKGQGVPPEVQPALEIFRWPTVDRAWDLSPPAPAAPESSEQTQQQEPNSDIPELYVLLAALEDNDFRPRLEGHRTHMDRLIISYCGNRTTFEIEGAWKSLTVYHVEDIPAAMIKRRALRAVGAGKTEVEC